MVFAGRRAIFFGETDYSSLIGKETAVARFSKFQWAANNCVSSGTLPAIGEAVS
jgi:hypothetical protein